MERPTPKDGGLLTIGVFFWVNLATAAVSPYQQANPIVRVLIEKEHHVMHLGGVDLSIIDATTGTKIARNERHGEVHLTCQLNGHIRASFSNGAKPSIDISNPIRIQSMGGYVRIDDSQYRDELYLYSFNGDCVVVNHLDLEKYVAGLLNSEMNANWNMAVLRAQAIAARTYAIYQMKEASSIRYRDFKPFDLSASVKDQVYAGANQERYKAIHAAQDTRGIVLTYHGKPIKAFYHSTCGGRTADSESVWGVRYPYIRPVVCGFCKRSPRFEWSFSMPWHELQSRLRNEGLVRGELLRVHVTERSRIGRVKKIEIEGTAGRTTIGGIKFREVVGNLHLRSTNFALTQNSNGWLVFEGHGSGHGVGMCQWGAKMMGDLGYNHVAILQHYYPDTQLSKLY